MVAAENSNIIKELNYCKILYFPVDLEYKTVSLSNIPLCIFYYYLHNI